MLPILLPKRQSFVELLVMHYHREALHMGWSQVLANMRKNFWVIRGQSTIRHYIKSCMKCKLRAAKSSEQIMAPLPRDRLLQGGECLRVQAATFSVLTLFQDTVELLNFWVAYLFVLPHGLCI